MSYFLTMVAFVVGLIAALEGLAWLWDRLTLPEYRRRAALRRHPAGRSTWNR